MTPPRTTFRRDIQGLRAVAVLSVALNHAQIARVSGGFVGVDVFFVISGFLITQLLLAEAGRTGRISLPTFYSRRARRILPAATVVTLVTVLASVLLLDYVRATAIIHDAVWATFFAANIHFGRVGTDYFAAGSPESPLQHYWSLAIEEQFYVVWPVLLAGLYLGYQVWRRRRGSPEPAAARRLGMTPVLCVLVVIGGLSLAWSLILTERNQTGAYFSTPARVWELALGAACAALAPRLEGLAWQVKAAVGWLGLVCIGVAIVGFSATTPYPGRAALLPVVGAALVIAGGCGPVRGGPGLLLGLKPFRLVGDWSYSLYLWHWPFLIIAAGYVGHPLTTTQNLGLLVAATATSYVTYRWVENPFRRPAATRSRRRRGLLLYPAAITLSLVGCIGANEMVAYEVASAADNPPITTTHFGGPDGQAGFSQDRTIALVEASVAAARNGLPIPGELRPSLLALTDNHANVHDCNYDDDSVRRLCPRGDVDSDKVLVLYGDSHAKHWIPALDTITQRAGYRAYYLVKPRCGAAIEAIIAHQPGEEDHVTACTDWQAWATSQVAKLKPDVIVVSEDTTPVDPGSTQVVAPGLEDELRTNLDDTVSALTAAGGRLVMIGDTPGLSLWPGNCLAKRGATLLGCASAPDQAWADSMAMGRAIARAHQGDFIDPSPWFCADNLCPAVIGSMVAYRDPGHITTAYSEHLASALGSALALAR